MSTIFHYGIPYMGSKDMIAESILKRLPAGKRFVDLFGGGAAMSHCALLSGKYDQVLYNELNKLVFELVQRAIAGEFNHKVFKPAFIEKADFKRLKDKDGYVKYIWSFGNKGTSYMFSDRLIDVKRKGHRYVIDGIGFDGFPVIGQTQTERRINLRRLVQKRVDDTIRKDPSLKADKRRMESLYELEQLERLERLQQLERLERLQQLEQLERLERLERLELSNKSYKDYRYREGDVVYCDPPYEGTARYSSDGFPHQEFYNWVASRDYPVYFSSYDISDRRFKLEYAFKKATLLSSGGCNKYVYEKLYSNINLL